MTVNRNDHKENDNATALSFAQTKTTDKGRRTRCTVQNGISLYSSSQILVKA